MPRPAVTLLALLLCACQTAEPPPARRSPPREDPKVRALDRLLGRQSAASRGQVQACVARAVDHTPGCDAGPATRRLGLRVALDQRYSATWPRWRGRLALTMRCVNALYRPTGLSWSIETLEPWDPGAQRHQLYRLLARIQREHPPDGRSVVLGVTVWDKRRIYATAGGEIGLSQRAACVVPSWPRVENDCLILAHELGHIAGAEHVPGQQWVMGWAARPVHLPVSDPVQRVLSRHAFHPRNAGVVALYRGARFTPRGLRLGRACARRVQAVDRCWGLR